MILPADMDKVLALAVLKCERNIYGELEWCGPLTPAEVLALDRANVELDRRDVDWAIDCKRSGRSYQRWIYFPYKDKEFLKLKERLS